MTNPEGRLIDFLAKKISVLSRYLLLNFVHHFLHSILQCFKHDRQEKFVFP